MKLFSKQVRASVQSLPFPSLPSSIFVKKKFNSVATVTTEAYTATYFIFIHFPPLPLLLILLSLQNLFRLLLPHLRLLPLLLLRLFPKIFLRIFFIVIGELMFIPSGWWHTVLNLDETWAVTQNYVDENNLENVAKFLQSKKSKKLWRIFSQGMEREFPEEISRVVGKIGNVLDKNCEEDGDDGGCDGGMMGGGGMEAVEEKAEPKKEVKSKWEEFVGNEEEDAAWQLF
jgi:hypothetical protein